MDTKMICIASWVLFWTTVVAAQTVGSNTPQTDVQFTRRHEVDIKSMTGIYRVSGGPSPALVLFPDGTFMHLYWTSMSGAVLSATGTWWCVEGRQVMFPTWLTVTPNPYANSNETVMTVVRYGSLVSLWPESEVTFLENLSGKSFDLALNESVWQRRLESFGYVRIATNALDSIKRAAPWVTRESDWRGWKVLRVLLLSITGDR